MANFSNLKRFILSFEGGYVNDPDDSGGETNKGITIKTWRGAGFDTFKKIPVLQVGKKCYTNVTKSLYEMTDAQWELVFKKYYWDRWKADEIQNQSIANLLVDWVWASGVWGIKMPQTLLKVTQDGIVGPKTLNALNSQEPEQLFKRLVREREAYIERLILRSPKNKKFEKGWYRRLYSIQYGNLVLNDGTVINE